MSSRSDPIGVFDSGVGGLSVLREIRRALPAEDLLYVADTANAPYGDRDAEFIRERSLAIVARLMEASVKAVVVACNTATGLAVDALRERYALPIVAVEPAVKPAASQTRSGVIGVIATTQTLASARFTRLVDTHASGINADITISMHRHPVSEWICLESGAWVEPHGVGLAETRLHDEQGPIGRAAQTLLVESIDVRPSPGASRRETP